MGDYYKLSGNVTAAVGFGIGTEFTVLGAKYGFTVRGPNITSTSAIGIEKECGVIAETIFLQGGSPRFNVGGALSVGKGIGVAVSYNLYGGYGWGVEISRDRVVSAYGSYSYGIDGNYTVNLGLFNYTGYFVDIGGGDSGKVKLYEF